MTLGADGRTAVLNVILEWPPSPRTWRGARSLMQASKPRGTKSRSRLPVTLGAVGRKTSGTSG